jgi:hypothetical protein
MSTARISLADDRGCGLVSCVGISLKSDLLGWVKAVTITLLSNHVHCPVTSQSEGGAGEAERAVPFKDPPGPPPHNFWSNKIQPSGAIESKSSCPCTNFTWAVWIVNRPSWRVTNERVEGPSLRGRLMWIVYVTNPITRGSLNEPRSIKTPQKTGGSLNGTPLPSGRMRGWGRPEMRRLRGYCNYDDRLIMII